MRQIAQIFGVKFICPRTQIIRKKCSIFGDWSGHLRSLHPGREERTFQSVFVSFVCTVDSARAQWSPCNTTWPQFPMTLSPSDPQSHPHLSQWALVLGASFLERRPSWRCCWLSAEHPPPLSGRCQARSSCPAGQHHPQPPPAPQLCSSLPCSLWEGLQFRLPRCVKTFQNQCLTSPLSFVNEIRPEE